MSVLAATFLDIDIYVGGFLVVCSGWEGGEMLARSLAKGWALGSGVGCIDLFGEFIGVFINIWM